MKNNLKYIVSIVVSVFLVSCFEDKGNYDYNLQDKNEIAGMDSSYTAIFMEPFTVDPKVKNSEKYSFLWTAFKYDETYPTIDTLSTAPVLQELMPLEPGKYHLELQLKDNANHYTQYARTTLFVTTEISIGWYVLKNNGNTSDVDIFMPSNKKLLNAIEQAHGQPMQGKGTSIVYYPIYRYRGADGKNLNTRAVGITTDKDIAIYNTNDLQTIYNRKDLFFDNADITEIPLRLRFSVLNNELYTNKRVYYVSTSNNNTSNKYGLPQQIDGKDIEPGLAMRTYQYTLIYDKKGKRFVSCSYSGAIAPLKREGSDGKVDKSIPDPSALGCYPVYMASMNMSKQLYGRTTGYLVMKHETKDEHYIYEIDNVSIARGKSTNPIKRSIPVAANLKINQAKVFGHNYELSYLYYPVGNIIYLYDTQTQTESEMMTGIDGEVTMIKNIYWQKPSDTAFNYLLIAVSKNGKYTINIYKMLGGRPDGNPVKVLEGDGEVNDIHYVTSIMTETDEQFYPYH